MLQILDIYKEYPNEIINYLENNEVTINALFGGYKLQIIYDNNSNCIKYFDANNLKNAEIGNEITDIENLFIPGLNKVIEKINSKIDLVKQYKYILCEVNNKKVNLITVVDKNNNINKDLNKVAKIFEFNIAPILYKGKLKENTIEKFKNVFKEEIIKTDILNFILDNNTKSLIKELLFNINLIDKSNKKCLQLILPINNIETDLINNTFDNIDKENNKKIIKDIFYQFGEAKTDEEFIELIKDSKKYNKLINLSSKLPNLYYNIQEDAINENIKKLIKSKGSLMKKIYEHYILYNFLKYTK